MITKAGADELKNSIQSFPINIFLIKIFSNTLCYNNYDFCRSFIQKSDSRITSFINILDTAATVFCTENSDFSEIKDFLKFNHINNIFCNEYAAVNLELNTDGHGVVLKYDEKSTCKKYFKRNNYPDYKTVYSLIEENFPVNDYNSFVSDLSFRINHGFARLITAPYGVIFTGWETEHESVISAIAVNKNKRNKGIGKKLFESMVFDLKKDKKHIYVYCEGKERQRFYEDHGFYVSDKYFIGKDFK